METKDHISEEKVNNKNLEIIQSQEAAEGGRLGNYADQGEGIVRIERNSAESEQEFRTMQEQHNANHALYYFSMIADAAIHGKRSGNDCEKIKRVKEHMRTLREFISEERNSVLKTINTLLQELEDFCPVQRKQFNAFIFKHWELIYAFAEAYGHHDRCFAKEKYQKLQDVVSGKYYFKAWWWKLIIPNLAKKLNPKCLKTVYSHIIQNAAFTKIHISQRKAKTADEKQTKYFFMSLFSNVACVMQLNITHRQGFLNGKSVYVESARDEILHLLHFIKHHYPTTPATGNGLWDACDHLSKYFNEFPKVNEDDSRKALQQMDQLCDAIGISYARKFSGSEGVK